MKAADERRMAQREKREREFEDESSSEDEEGDEEGEREHNTRVNENKVSLSRPGALERFCAIPPQNAYTLPRDLDLPLCIQSLLAHAFAHASSSSSSSSAASSSSSSSSASSSSVGSLSFSLLSSYFASPASSSSSSSPSASSAAASPSFTFFRYRNTDLLRALGVRVLTRAQLLREFVRICFERLSTWREKMVLMDYCRHYYEAELNSPVRTF